MSGRAYLTTSLLVVRKLRWEIGTVRPDNCRASEWPVLALYKYIALRFGRNLPGESFIVFSSRSVGKCAGNVCTATRRARAALRQFQWFLSLFPAQRYLSARAYPLKQHTVHTVTSSHSQPYEKEYSRCHREPRKNTSVPWPLYTS